MAWSEKGVPATIVEPDAAGQTGRAPRRLHGGVFPGIRLREGREFREHGQAVRERRRVHDRALGRRGATVPHGLCRRHPQRHLVRPRPPAGRVGDRLCDRARRRRLFGRDEGLPCGRRHRHRPYPDHRRAPAGPLHDPTEGRGPPLHLLARQFGGAAAGRGPGGPGGGVRRGGPHLFLRHHPCHPGAPRPRAAAQGHRQRPQCRRPHRLRPQCAAGAVAIAAGHGGR